MSLIVNPVYLTDGLLLTKAGQALALAGLPDDFIVKGTAEDVRPQFDFGDGHGPVPAHRHPNGGGWVADTATVAETAFVGPDARVFHLAQVFGSAQVSDSAHVYESAWVSGSVRVLGSARVFGKSIVSGYAEVSGSTQVFGSALIHGSARSALSDGAAQ